MVNAKCLKNTVFKYQGQCCNGALCFQSATIDEKHAEMIKWQLIVPTKIVHIIQYALIAIATTMVVIATVSAVHRHRVSATSSQGEVRKKPRWHLTFAKECSVCVH